MTSKSDYILPGDPLAHREGLTGWFTEQQPVHPGPYQVQLSYGDGHCVLAWCCWSGSFWGPTAFTRHGAQMLAHNRGTVQRRTWRGLAAPA